MPKAGIKYQPAAPSEAGGGSEMSPLSRSPLLVQLRLFLESGSHESHISCGLEADAVPLATGRPGRARARQGPSGAPGPPAGCGRGLGHKSAGPEPTPTWSGPSAATSHGRAVQPRTAAHTPHTCRSRRPARTAPETLPVSGPRRGSGRRAAVCRGVWARSRAGGSGPGRTQTCSRTPAA